MLETVHICQVTKVFQFIFLAKKKYITSLKKSMYINLNYQQIFIRTIKEIPVEKKITKRALIAS